ncbi:hypothetical protein U6B65_12760 [Oscillospiraceae bacterium MB08-C2-2]|nr:hypothetical protein U6B65_12760 [Oscillospiraceae bacterium MB08-C2-2]
MAKKRWHTGIILLLLVSLVYIIFSLVNPNPEVEMSFPNDQQTNIVTPNEPQTQSELPSLTEGQLVDIAIDYYYGDWLVGEMVGDGYVYDAIDPKGAAIGGILSLTKEQAVFHGPKNTMVLDNPEYRFVLQNPPEFASVERASYSSFDFQNAYVIQIFILDGDKMWRPEGLGPIWIKDIDTMIVRHHVFHIMRRVKTE